MRKNGKMRTGVAMVAAVGMTLAAPGAAAAADGTIGVTAGTLRFQAGPATANNVSIWHDSSSSGPFFIFDDPATVLAATGCQPATPGGLNVPEAACPSGPIVRISVLAGAANDKVSLTPTTGTTGPNPVFADTTLPVQISGGPGNDNLTAGGGPDVVLGGTGVNIARGMGGNDRLLMRNGTRDTLIDCGAGTDTAVIDKIDPKPIACESVLRPS